MSISSTSGRHVANPILTPIHLESDPISNTKREKANYLHNYCIGAVAGGMFFSPLLHVCMLLMNACDASNSCVYI